MSEQLKFSRSISIPKLRRNGEAISSNLLYAKTEKDGDQYMPNPDTFRKLDTDRGYESQSINSIGLGNLVATEPKYNTKSKKMSIIEENKFKLPLHLLKPNPTNLTAQTSAAGTNRSEKKKVFFGGNQSNRTGEHQSSYNTADFTHEERCDREETLRRNDHKMNKLAEIVAQQQSDSGQILPDKKTIEILNYYNRSMNSEMSSENVKENKMLKDALYATIKLVLDQNKQIKQLKEVVTHRKSGRDGSKNATCVDISKNYMNTTDLSLLDMSGNINPITTVNNFMKEHMPTDRTFNRSDKDHSKISHNDIDNSVNEVIFACNQFRPC